MSSCACALKVADLSPTALGSPGRCLSANSPYRPATAVGVLREIVRKEGLPALWRGTDTAILASIPMVGVYMPLYDHLYQRLTPSLGAYAPAVAGSAARTLAVVLVGPLELVRTRQQGGAAGARTAWGALRDTLRETTAAAAAPAAGAGSVGAASPTAAAAAGTRPLPASSTVAAAGVLQVVPRLWTGVVATLARDVPFSALYWLLVERLRGELLAVWQAQPPGQGQAQAESQALGQAQVRSLQPSLPAPAPAASPNQHLQQQDHLQHSLQHQHPSANQTQHPAGQSTHQNALHPGAAGGAATQPAGHSGRAVLAANLIAGSAAGAIAAIVTTPFDVVKTQLQLRGPAPAAVGAWAGAAAGIGSGGAAADGEARGTLDAVRRVLRTEGPAGLFRGWGPRAARTAPACAVVVASYEVLKLLL